MVKVIQPGQKRKPSLNDQRVQRPAAVFRSSGRHFPDLDPTQIVPELWLPLLDNYSLISKWGSRFFQRRPL
jgi:hypothetical protein